MTIEYIRYYLEVCRCGSIQKAAKQLFISSQGLGQGIRRLESSIGAKLLERTQTGVKMTELGELFYSQACIIEQEISRLEALAEVWRGDMGTHIEIGLVEKSKYFSCMQSCINDYTDIDSSGMMTFAIRLYKSGADLLDALRCGEIGIGMMFHITEMEGIEYMTFSPYSRLVLLVSADNPLAQRSSVRLSELNEMSFITAGENDPFSSLISHLCNESGFAPKNAFFTTENTFVAKLVDSGKAGILLRESYCRSILQFCSHSVAIPIEPEMPVSDSIIIRKDESSTGILEFAEHLFRYFKKINIC